ncbi:MAG: bifunctional 3-deoxy-7-phosphoheptulonate synthase/chorismate mutase, partial [Planctomycetes bacterium]|nr:bifunctional 3-deoxy-7-phosphoheptulonate synthase/chorismate mutase [Planctomycetota bacterium]
SFAGSGEAGYQVKVAGANEETLVGRHVIVATGSNPRALPGVEDAQDLKQPFRRVSREFHPVSTEIKAGGSVIGDGGFQVIAGPCAVESEEQIHDVAREAAHHGATLLRGGVYKPRSSPYAFQGLGEQGLRFLASAARENGLASVSEVMSVRQIDEMVKYVDVLQIGARNMQNFDLLREVGATSKPVVLKRGLSATIEELLLAAEYISDAGNPNIILCERGIRTYERMTRNTLDIAAVPLLKQLSHLPVLVDPSHAAGRRDLVKPLALASLAAGADGVMIEIHPNPDCALSDGPQSLTYPQYAGLMDELSRVAGALGKCFGAGQKDHRRAAVVTT